MTFAEMILAKLSGHGSVLGARAIAAAIGKDETIVSAVLEALQLGGLVDSYSLGDGVRAWELTTWGATTAERLTPLREGGPEWDWASSKR